MVGSGFSRNAELKVPGGRPPPDWAAVARAMSEKLRLVLEDGDGNHASASAVDALATAQRYSDEFGRAELHGFLRDQVRDDEMEPGEPHRRLLELPWGDVFTTNWDTLLERTRELTTTVPYDVVRAVHELPLASRPRIVKLHGSLPAHFPLIATEQDYIEYPRSFAPFVNTARQALMETVFLLLGFSGDDPNFLRWSEWVQEELGSSAPRIYLAGWLNLAEETREDLEDRGVSPIDLAQHPKREEWREQQMEHRLATDWLLTALELGRPYPDEEWPKAIAQPGAAIVPRLEPVDRPVWRAPRVAAALRDGDESDQSVEEWVDGIVSIWAHNRELYPGWLALPEHLRRELLDPGTREIGGDLLRTSKELRILEELPGRLLAARLRIIHEIIWRREIRLEPLGSDLATAATELLEEVTKAPDGFVEREFDRVAVRRVALALTTHARLGFSRAEFDEAARVASQFAEHDRNARHYLEYERCLWALYEIDIGSLIEHLDAWDIEAGDPYWVVRKASLMFEAGHGSEQVVPMIRSAVASLRLSRGYSFDISVLSRESWAAYLERRLERVSGSDVDGSDPHRTRARELARFNCDPASEIRGLINAVEWRPEREKGPGFELGEGTRPHRTLQFKQEGIPTSDDYRAKGAYRLVRLAEVVGLPTLSDRWPPTKAMLDQASEALYRDDQKEFALRLMLRITSYDGDELIRKLLSRPNLASLPERLVDAIAARCEAVIEYYTRRGLHYRGAKGTISPRERVRVAVEMLARLALRSKPGRAAEILRIGLAIYGTPMYYGDVLFRGAIRNLLSWSWDALPVQGKADLALDLLAAPIVGVDGYSPNPYGFLDPGELIDRGDQTIPIRDQTNDEKWQATVRLLVRALGCGPEARSRAMLRLVQVAMAGRLTADEQAKVAGAIWAGDEGDDDGLPGEERLRHWVYLRMPQSGAGVAEEWFREKWLSAVDLTGVDGETIDEMLLHIGDVMEQSAHEGLSFEFRKEDDDYIVRVLSQWAATPLPEFLLPVLEDERIQMVRAGIRGAATLLMHVDAPKDVAESLYGKQRQLADSGVPSMQLLVGLVRSLKQREAEIHTVLRKGFSSGDPPLVSNAAVAMQFWLNFAGRGMVPRPPSDLIREIGVIIATRRVDALADALWVAAWVFSDGEEGDWQELRPLAAEGLGYLVEELAYGREFPKNVDVPLLRWRCVGLARAMYQRNCDEKAVRDWLAAAGNDPLPEVWHKASDIVV